jgi:hypothetical protein
MSDEERNAYQSGLAGTGPPASGGSAYSAWIMGDAIRRETQRRLEENAANSRAGASSASGFGGPQSSTFGPSTGYSPSASCGSPTADGGGGAADGGPMSETTARVLSWVAVLAVLGLMARAQGPRLGEHLYTLFVLLVPLWVGLYPINGLATAGAYMWLDRMVPLPVGPVNAAAAGALVVFVLTHRLEHSLARGTGYRVGRHVLRLLVFGAAAYAQLLRYERGYLVAPIAYHVWRFLQNPPRTLIVVLGTMAIVHFLTWTDNSMRARWHEILDLLRLRPPRS